MYHINAVDAYPEYTIRDCRIEGVRLETNVSGNVARAISLIATDRLNGIAERR